MSDLTPDDGHCSRCGRPFSDNIRDVLLPGVEEIKTASKDTLDYSDREASDLRDAMYAVVTRQSPALPEITEQFQVIADYLCVNVGRCTCDGPFDAVPGVDHRDGCGYEPLLTLDELTSVLSRAGRVVLDLPEPNDPEDEQPHWTVAGHGKGLVYVQLEQLASDDPDVAVVHLDIAEDGLWMPLAVVEPVAAALLAAGRLAAEGGEPRHG